MRNKLLISIVAILSLLLYYNSTLKIVHIGDISITEKYHPFDQTMTVTFKIENKWDENGFYYLFNPVVVNIQNIDKNGRKIVEIPINFKDFVAYDNYHEAVKTVRLSYKQFRQSKRVKL